MSTANVSNEGSLWKNLSNEVQQELIEIEKDSHNIENLMDHSAMKLKYKNENDIQTNLYFFNYFY